MTYIKKVAENTIAQSIGKVLTVLVSLVITAFITRYLGPKHYGFYALITTYLSLATSFYDIGVSGIGSREIAKHPKNSLVILNNVLSLRSIFGIITFLGFVLITFFTYRTAEFTVLRNATLIAAFTILINNLTSSLITIYLAKLKMGYIAASEVINKIVVLVGVFLAIQLNWGLVSIFGMIVLGNLVQLIMVIIVAKTFFKFRFYFSRKYWKSLFRDSWSLGLFLILSSLLFNLGMIFVSYLRSPEEVGLYGASSKILEIILNFASFFGVSVFPIIAYRLQIKDHIGLQRALRRSIEFMLIFAIPIVVSVFFLSREIISIIAGNEFFKSIPALKILSLAIFFGFFNALAGYLLTAKNQQKTALWTTIAGLIFNGVLNFIFIPKYGFIAAAYNTLFAQFVSTFLNGFFVFKFYKPVLIPKNIFQILAVALILIGFLFFFNPVNSLILRFVSVFIGVILYAIILIFINREFKTIFLDLISNYLAKK